MTPLMVAAAAVASFAVLLFIYAVCKASAEWQRAEAAADVLREAAQAMRAAKEPYHWNLRDPRDPERSYSPDVWLEARAERIRREGVQ